MILSSYMKIKTNACLVHYILRIKTYAEILIFTWNRSHMINCNFFTFQGWIFSELLTPTACCLIKIDFSPANSGELQQTWWRKSNLCFCDFYVTNYFLFRQFGRINCAITLFSCFYNRWKTLITLQWPNKLSNALLNMSTN